MKEVSAMKEVCWLTFDDQPTIIGGQPTPYSGMWALPSSVGPLGLLLTKFELIWPKFKGWPTCQLWPNKPIFCR